MKVKFLIDTSAVDALIGAGYGIAETMEKTGYLGHLMDAAFESVSQAFNQEVTAQALATGNFKHMFEWGTQGINRHRSNMRPNPDSEMARLWRNEMLGNGLSRTLTFAFKPSVAHVPLPTVKDTGIDAGTLSQLNDQHVFWNKAFVMESGARVTISPIQAKFLFIPFYRKPPAHAKPSEKKRGYILFPGTVGSTPGKKTQGTFTTYWTNFWEGRGTEMIQEEVFKSVETDVEKAIAGIEHIRGGFKLPAPGGNKGNISAAKSKTISSMTRSAKARKNGL